MRHHTKYYYLRLEFREFRDVAIKIILVDLVVSAIRMTRKSRFSDAVITICFHFKC